MRRTLLSPLVAWLLAGAAWAGPHGFIVELKNAPAHTAPVRGATALSARADPEAVQRERLQRVVAAAGLASSGVGVRAQGRAAHVLDFGRALSAPETEAMLARLRASPEVAWAEPNDRESLQSTTPRDPYFPGTESQ